MTPVSIPFREDLHSDSGTQQSHGKRHTPSFHPFQGRPSFGLNPCTGCCHPVLSQFPSLSGKTFIRTIITDPRQVATRVTFPSLSGKTFIRTRILLAARKVAEETVSIPFREDLHSDKKVYENTKTLRIHVSIPFREDLHSDKQIVTHTENTTNHRFPSLSGKTFIRTYGGQSYDSFGAVCFHPFQGRPSFGQ